MLFCVCQFAIDQYLTSFLIYFVSVLITGSQDQSISVLDCTTGKMLIHIENAHEHPIYSMYYFDWHQHSLLATGDDEGVIKVY